MSQVQFFDELSKCSKCGGNDIGSRFTSSGQAFACWSNEHPKGGHIHRSCRRCFHEWVELPLDAEVPTDA